MEDGFGEPVVEFLAAAVVRRPRRLRRAFRVVGRADQPNVEVIVVAPPRLYPAEPAAVAPGFAAQGLLDRRIHKDAGHLWVFRGGPDHVEMRRRPNFWVDIGAVF